ncbi:MAG: HAD family hydrolase [Anaerorhabdus sp.]
MIKLIVTDMDGCFLNNNKQPHPQSLDLIQQCIDKGIHFTVASGRSFPSVKSFFEPVLDHITLICDNGAFIYHRGKEFSVTPILESDVALSIESSLNLDGVTPILSDPQQAYMQRNDQLRPEVLEDIKNYYPILDTVDNLQNYTHNIIKIACYDEKGAEYNCYPVLKEIPKASSVLLSADVWVDVINPLVNKGAAVNKLQSHLNIQPEQTAVFGDYLNDLEMILSSTHSFAPKGAHPQIKALASTVIGDNNDWSVYHTILSLIQ